MSQKVWQNKFLKKFDTESVSKKISWKIWHKIYLEKLLKIERKRNWQNSTASAIILLEPIKKNLPITQEVFLF